MTDLSATAGSSGRQDPGMRPRGADGASSPSVPLSSTPFAPTHSPAALSSGSALSFSTWQADTPTAPQSKGQEKEKGKGKAVDKIAQPKAPFKKNTVCQPCAKRKVACDHKSPLGFLTLVHLVRQGADAGLFRCSRCVAGGVECVPPSEAKAKSQNLIRSHTDAMELREQIAALQKTLDLITKNNVFKTRPPQQLSASTSSTTLAAPTVEPETFDARETDLCQALSELAIVGMVPTGAHGTDSFSPIGTSGEDFIAEARNFCELFALAADPESDHKPASAEFPFVTASLFDEHPSIDDILSHFPAEPDIQLGLKLFEMLIKPFWFPIESAVFERRMAELKEAKAIEDKAERDRKIDLPFLATFYAVMVVGVGSTLSQEGPQRADRERKVARWNTAAMMALAAARFVEKPDVDALLSFALDNAITLGLHHDPDLHHRGRDLTLAEAEERRLIWWNLFCAAIDVGGTFGRNYAQINLSQTTTKVPIHCLPEELAMGSKEGRAAAERREAETGAIDGPLKVLRLRRQIDMVAKRVMDTLYGPDKVAYSEVERFHEQYMEINRSLSATLPFRVNDNGTLAIAGLADFQAGFLHNHLSNFVVRLHKPWLVLAGADPRYKLSRESIIKFAERSLIVSMGPSIAHENYGAQNYTMITICTLLGMELLQAPDAPDSLTIHKLVQRALDQCSQFQSTSSLCRKGTNVLRFLLHKYDQVQGARQAPAKRMRRSGTAVSSLANNLAWEDTWGSSSSEELLRRKTPATPESIATDSPSPSKAGSSPAASTTSDGDGRDKKRFFASIFSVAAKEAHESRGKASKMAKSKNHTAHNQTRKAHRNGIKKPKTNKYPSQKGVDPKFRRNARHAAQGTQKALAAARAEKSSA
ncbi:hypothetical protein MNV49_004177 [Pseudohyphozyma bogoriensis]|nr:hypothetical protein MNV49_004177 [Pseudohyphozyma bogoriensis]